MKSYLEECAEQLIYALQELAMTMRSYENSLMAKPKPIIMDMKEKDKEQKKK